ncbi:MAG: bifunctional folylpolyglutamate synthase/dihydrofolate synthase [Actinomycetota bacterium]
MSFKDASAYLDALGIDAMKSLGLSLHRMEAICDALNHPERAVPMIHVTGTNGKTSTARIASSLLTATGLTVGTYTSPHLQTIRERITLNGEPITEGVFAEVFEHLLPFVQVVEADLGEKLSYFEVLTAMYFLWASEAVDVTVAEVGLGGTWDATNVAPSAVAVITNVGRDHMELLGDDPATIASEKVGIIKPGDVVVTSERSPDILTMIRHRAAENDAPVFALDDGFEISENKMALGGRYLSLTTSVSSYEGLFLPLHGAHQGTNAAVALQAVTSFLPMRELGHDVVLEGFANTKAAGRLETLPLGGEVPVILDVAHNPDGMSALVSSLAETFPFKRVVFVVGILQGKDERGMLLEMARIPCALVVTQPESGRAIEAGELHETATSLGLEASVEKTVRSAVDAARNVAASGDLVCITGSHYVVGEARSYLLDDN